MEGGSGGRIPRLNEDVAIGARGSGPFDNDGAPDWVLKLRRSGDQDYPVRVPNELKATELFLELTLMAAAFLDDLRRIDARIRETRKRPGPA